MQTLSLLNFVLYFSRPTAMFIRIVQTSGSAVQALDFQLANLGLNPWSGSRKASGKHCFRAPEIPIYTRARLRLRNEIMHDAKRTHYTSQELLFLPLCACLSVCQQDNSNNFRRITMNFFGRVAWATNNSWLHFHGNPYPDHDADGGIFKRIIM